MPSIQAASALLTAESIIIAASSIALQQDKIYNGLIELVPTWVLGLLGLAIGVSFLTSCVYLYFVEFYSNEGKEIPLLSYEKIFAFALFTLIIPVYVYGFLIGYLVATST